MCVDSVGNEWFCSRCAELKLIRVWAPRRKKQQQTATMVVDSGYIALEAGISIDVCCCGCCWKRENELLNYVTVVRPSRIWCPTSHLPAAPLRDGLRALFFHRPNPFTWTHSTPTHNRPVPPPHQERRMAATDACIHRTVDAADGWRPSSDGRRHWIRRRQCDGRIVGGGGARGQRSVWPPSWWWWRSADRRRWSRWSCCPLDGNRRRREPIVKKAIYLRATVFAGAAICFCPSWRRTTVARACPCGSCGWGRRTAADWCRNWSRWWETWAAWRVRWSWSRLCRRRTYMWCGAQRESIDYSN